MSIRNRKADKATKPRPIEPIRTSGPPLSQRLGRSILRMYVRTRRYTGDTLIYFNRLDGLIAFVIVVVLQFMPREPRSVVIMDLPKALPTAFLLFVLLSYGQGHFRRGTGSSQLIFIGLLLLMVAVAYSYSAYLGGSRTALLLSVAFLMVLPGLFEMAEHNKHEQAKELELMRKHQAADERLRVQEVLIAQSEQHAANLSHLTRELSDVLAQATTAHGLAMVTQATIEQDVAARQQQMQQTLTQAQSIGATSRTAVPATPQYQPPPQPVSQPHQAVVSNVTDPPPSWDFGDEDENDGSSAGQTEAQRAWATQFE